MGKNLSFRRLIIATQASIIVMLAFQPAGLCLEEISESIKLSPDGVKRLILDRSFGIKQAELTRDSADEGIPEAKGTFDTNMELEATHQIDKGKRESTIFETRTDTTTWTKFPRSPMRSNRFLRKCRAYRTSATA